MLKRHTKRSSSLATVCLAILLVAPTRAPSAELFGPMKGLFWMAGNLERASKDTLLQQMEQVLSRNEYLSGVFLLERWIDLEPEPGRYDWQLLDAQVSLARKHKKMYKLSIFPGMYTPPWVYQAGCAPFETTLHNPYRPDSGKLARMPLPWDETYHKHFHRLLGKIAKRYGSDRNFVAIVLTGANLMSDEMHLPKSPEDLQKWRSIPDYQARLVAVYQKLIDFYANTFPHQQFCLHVSMPLPGMEAEVAAIVKYGAERHPSQFTLQSCQLNGRTDNTDVFSYRIVMDYKARVRHGFQNVAGWRYAGERQGSMELTVFNLVRPVPSIGNFGRATARTETPAPSCGNSGTRRRNWLRPVQGAVTGGREVPRARLGAVADPGEEVLTDSAAIGH